jgi:hypothetical protein
MSAPKLPFFIQKVTGINKGRARQLKSCVGRLSITKKQAEAKLWQGQVDEAKALFSHYRRQQAHNFCAYLTSTVIESSTINTFKKQRISSIGSGAVESAVKQIDRRLKISGAQWKLENVSSMLQLRCAYLNGLLAV